MPFLGDRFAIEALWVAGARPPSPAGFAGPHRHREHRCVGLLAACRLRPAGELVGERAAEPWADLDAPEPVALGRATRALARPRLLLRAIHDDESTRLLELEVCDLQVDRLGDAKACPHEHLGERPVDLDAGVQVARDLVQAQVVVLDVGRGEALDAERGIAGDHALLDRGVQAHDEGAERVVDRLGRDLADFDPLAPARPSTRARARRRACRAEPPRTPATGACARRPRTRSTRSARDMPFAGAASPATSRRTSAWCGGSRRARCCSVTLRRAARAADSLENPRLLVELPSERRVT